ncbi:DNA recombination protein RmuC [Caedibacter taeniospiralis]|uniref:DNA recombination protein RmuC n=1 Tax=Caedibacter taeniospiralis TaxID=28907 RepID=UPI000C27A0B6|nr:DNA recombination protein RmuC [Caedibacter taeniospiralis]
MITGLAIVAFAMGMVIGFLMTRPGRNALQTKLKTTEKSLTELELSYQDKEAQLWQKQQENIVLTTDHKHYQEQEQRLTQELSMVKQKLEIRNDELSKLQNKLASDAARFQALEKEVTRLEMELQNASKKQDEMLRKIDTLMEEKSQLQAENSSLSKQIETELYNSQEKIALLENAKKSLTEQFENLANRIFEEKGERFANQNKVNLAEILQPFKNDIHEFKKKVDDVYVHEAKERASLQKEVNKLFELNQEMNKEAKNLTKALKGDKKLQGDWGEVVLERVLESSGLRKGYEYEVQNSFKGSDDDDNEKTLRPDAIVHLPDGKDVIIDAKVSLVSYDAYTRAETETLKLECLKKHIDAIRQHITLLSSKNYERLSAINSLDFILMFMPIEAAFVVAFQHDDSLFHEAFKKRIIIVTPTTLLATLGTIRNTWKYESLNKNASDITERATKMLDKFRGFVEDIEALGRQIDKSKETYADALNKLTKGRGNLISQAIQLEDMGVHMKKALPKDMVEHAELERTKGED